MPEKIKLEFPTSNVLSDSYRTELQIREIEYQTLYFHFSRIEDTRKAKEKTPPADTHIHPYDHRDTARIL